MGNIIAFKYLSGCYRWDNDLFYRSRWGKTRRNCPKFSEELCQIFEKGRKKSPELFLAVTIVERGLTREL